MADCVKSLYTKLIRKSTYVCVYVQIGCGRQIWVPIKVSSKITVPVESVKLTSAMYGDYVHSFKK